MLPNVWLIGSAMGDWCSPPLQPFCSSARKGPRFQRGASVAAWLFCVTFSMQLVRADAFGSGRRACGVFTGPVFLPAPRYRGMTRLPWRDRTLGNAKGPVCCVPRCACTAGFPGETHETGPMLIVNARTMTECIVVDQRGIFKSELRRVPNHELPVVRDHEQPARVDPKRSAQRIGHHVLGRWLRGGRLLDDPRDERDATCLQRLIPPDLAGTDTDHERHAGMHLLVAAVPCVLGVGLGRDEQQRGQEADPDGKENDADEANH